MIVRSKNWNRKDLINSRIHFLVFFLLVGVGLLTWRMFQKSVIDHPRYVLAAENQYEITKELPPRRGTILAFDHSSKKLTPIAATEEMFDISVVPKNVRDKREAARILSSIFDELKEEEVFDKINNNKLYLPPLVRNVSKDKKDEISRKGFVGLVIERHYVRQYPEAGLAAQILGFVNRDGQGNYGLEEYYDNVLRGQAGSVLGERDTQGRIFATKEKIDPKNGVSLETTLEHNIQFFVQKKLQQALQETKAQSGQIIVMDPNNGDIIALAAEPGFDPNNFAQFAKTPQVFLNPVVSAVYEPGSIMKPITASIALDKGKLTLKDQGIFGNSVKVQGYTIKNAMGRAFGKSTIEDIIVNSDNVGMVWVGQHLSFEELRQGLLRYGFSQKTLIDLPAELAGKMPTLEEWRDIHQATLMFGQGIAVTPIQMLRAWSAMINGGTLVVPHLVKRLVGERGTVVEAEFESQSNVISQETSATMRRILEQVVERGFYRKVRLANHRLGAKTGTAQIADPSGGYSKDEFIHNIVGFIPLNKPQFIVMVKLDKPTSANFATDTAGPVLKEVLNYLINYYNIPPDKIAHSE